MQKLSDFKAAFKQAPKGKKAASKKSASAAAAAAGKVDGVGTGALAAAKAAVGVDVESIITWKQGQPVPYSFLAETFQVGAEGCLRQSKRRGLSDAGQVVGVV